MDPCVMHAHVCVSLCNNSTFVYIGILHMHSYIVCSVIKCVHSHMNTHRQTCNIYTQTQTYTHAYKHTPYKYTYTQTYNYIHIHTWASINLDTHTAHTIWATRLLMQSCFRLSAKLQGLAEQYEEREKVRCHKLCT